MAKTSEKALPKPVAVKAPAKGDHVFLVDGSSYIFRAYHALPPLNRKSDGLQVNAVLGFCNMLWKLLRDMPADNRPTHLAIVFDKSEITFRNKLYPDYKAHRARAPDDLIPQFPLIREAVRAFDLPCLEQVGFEADDLIATYVREACERGAIATIVSSDKDLMQLVTDCVTMYDTMKDRRIGIPEVIEKFGVPPEKVVEVQALAGDSTDNVPGVPGIGVKTAAQLIVEYGDLGTLLLRAGEIKQPKRREALIQHADKARISRQLVLLDDKVDLEVPLDELAVHEPDARKLIAFLKAMEFSTLTRRVAEYAQIDPADIEPDPGYKSGASVFAPPPSGGEAARGESTLFDNPGSSAAPTLPLKGGSSAPRVAQGRKPDTQPLTPISLAAPRAEAARKTRIDRSKHQTIRKHDDAQLMSYALDAGRIAHGLDALAERWLGHATLSFGELTGSGKAKLTFDQVAIDRATAYSAEDADVILRLWRVLKPRLVAERMTSVYETLERPLISVLARMERRGISIDREVLSRLSGEFAQTAARVEAEIQEIAGRTEDGRKIRRAFIASPGHKLVSADYSQIELRLLAEIADIPVLKQAFRDGLDIHAMTASEMFGVPIKGMPGEVRRRAKAINFGIIYGISAFGLANQLGIAREEASAYIKKQFERFPGIRAYMDETRASCRTHGYVKTLFGRKCHYPDIKASNASARSFNECAGINARLQGTAADIIRRAMIRMEDALVEKKLSAQMLLQVHDALIFQGPDDEVAATFPVVQHVMQDAPFPAVLLSLPRHVDARAADNWDEAH